MTDRRTLRTRQAILDSFLALLLTEGFERLAASDVIERANVGRSTFYDHFTGKEDLLRAVLSVPFSALAATVLPDASAEALAPTIAHFRDQRRLLRDLLAGQTRGLLVRSLTEAVEANLPPGAGTLPGGLVAAMIAESQLGLLLHWVIGRDAVGPEEIAAALVASARAAVVAVLRPAGVPGSAPAPS
jgi:AcrR family transcriptional regulator